MFALLLTKGMDPFYQNITSFPTVIFTFFLAISVLYWIVAVLGWVDIDLFDLDAPEADAASSGSDATSANALAGLMLKLGLHGVPLTVVISFLSLLGWLIAYYSMHMLNQWVASGWLHLLLSIAVLVFAVIIGLLMTALVVKPLKGFFIGTDQHVASTLMGRVALVRTSRVDHSFGEASVDDQGAGLIIKIRSTDESVFQYGDRVVLIEYVSDGHFYYVVSEQEFLGTPVNL